MSDKPARCHFYIRERVTDDPTYRYRQIHMRSPEGNGYLTTAHPPMIGDLIHLYDQISKSGGVYRVLDRCWGHSGFGSTNWPYIEPAPIVGPSLDVIVEAFAGPFVNEAEASDDDDD